MNYRAIVDESINKIKDSQVDMLGASHSDGEYKYLKGQTDAYVRTVQDIDKIYNDDRTNVTILEIGSFYGAVSVSLKTIGYNISALDIPEYYNSQSVRDLYEKCSIPFAGVNLRSYQLPYESNSFDMVVICEVIEHLNFNPLPVLKEINRILKKGGLLYIGMPNQAHITKRVKLAIGKSIHSGIDDFFAQLDRNDNMIVGLHWREYTLTETIQMIEKMGFDAISQYYYEGGDIRSISFKNLVRKMLYAVPSFRPYQVVVGKKVFTPDHDFWLTEANS